ncbi:MAG: hypothetical protein GX190_02855 [Mollicutes bacterium]|nr:hypothetical protein [Mollicutes bacterium]
MSALIEFIKKKKKLIIIVSITLLIPYIIPMIELLVEMILALGNYVGTKIRYIADGKIC